MIIHVKTLLMRLGILLAFLMLLAGTVVLLRKEQTPPPPQITLASETQRTAWLTLHGWQVGAPHCTVFPMPETFRTPNGQSWLNLQHAQGISPEQFAGAECTAYRYAVSDDSRRALYAELLLCGDTLAGAQIYDAETQAMHPVL